MQTLCDKALLVSLNIRQWSGKKEDKSTSRDVEQRNQAYNAGRYTKTLLDGKELKDVRRCANDLRQFLYDNTLPWGQQGERLLPAKNYFYFQERFTALKLLFDKACRTFFASYKKLQFDARSRLNRLYCTEDYPPLFEMQTKFSVDVKYLPIPSSNDFRLEVDRSTVENLRNQIQQEIQQRFNNAIKEVWVRIREVLTHMVERLSEHGAHFKNSLVENIRELVDVLPRLNISNDPDITDVVEAMRSLLVEPDQLRTDDQVRRETAEQAQSLLDKIQGYLA